MATTAIPVSSWQTIVIATIFQFTKSASDRVIMQLNAAKLRESHASYDMAGNKFKVQCLKVDADKAYRVLNNIIKKIIAEEEEKTMDDPDYEPHVTRLFESYLGDSLNEHDTAPRSATTSSDESDNHSDNHSDNDDTESPDLRLVCKSFMPQDPILLEHIDAQGIKVQLQKEYKCEIDQDVDDRGVSVKAYEEKNIEAVIEKLQAIDLERIHTPIVRHISMAAGKDKLRLVKLANLKEPTLGRILLSPSSPHVQSLHNSYVLLIHVYSNEAQKHKGFERIASEHPRATDVDLFAGIQFATNYQLSTHHNTSEILDSPQKAVASQVGEWINGLREAAEESEAQKNSTSGKILALFGDNEVLKNKIPPPALPTLPSKSLGTKNHLPTVTPSNSKQIPLHPITAVPTPRTSRITKFSETPAPSESWERFDTKRLPEPVTRGRWGEEVVGSATASQSLNVFAKGFTSRKAQFEQSELFSQSKTDLIDLSDGADQEHFGGVPLIPPPGLSEVLQPEIAAQNIRALEQTIVEKMEEEETAEPPTLRRTMRQKAAPKLQSGRRAKKPGVKTATAHALLKEEASDIISGLSSSSAITTPSEGPSRVNSPAKSAQLDSDMIGMNESIPKNPVPPNSAQSQSSIAFVHALQEGLQAGKCYKGFLSLKVQLGVVLLLEKHVPAAALQGKEPSPASTLIPKLSSSRGFATAEDSFTTAVTSTPKDLSGLLYTLNINASSPAVKPYAVYEVICQRANGDYARIHVDASEPKNSWIMPGEPTLIACAYMHFPQAIHDARALVLSDSRRSVNESPELQAFVNKLKISMSDHDPTLPTIFGEDYGNLRVKAVYIRSTTTYTLPNKNCVLRVDRVHDLECSRPQTDDQAVGNFNAGPSDRATMVDDWRVWYEMSVHLAKPPIELDRDRGLEQSQSSMWDRDNNGDMSEAFVNSLIALKTASSEVVYRMRVVGLKNRGPAFKHWQKIDEIRRRRGEVESYW